MPLVSKTFSDIITFTRASTATYFNSAGTLTSAAINEPRLDYNPSTLAAQGLLIEESRSNLATYSAQFDNASGWTMGSGIIVTSNVITAPDGTISADQLASSGATGFLEKVLAITSGTTYTFSCFFKKQNTSTVTILLYGTHFNSGGANVTGTYNLDTGVATGVNGTASMVSVGNGWYRCVLTKDATTSGSFSQQAIRLANATADLYAWGYQIEAGSFATSYIPTTTTALTRAADVASVNTLSPWYNAVEGTLFAEAQKIANDPTTTFPRLACFDDGTLANAIQIVWNPGVSRLYGNIQNSSVTQADVGTNGITQTNVNKIALGFAANNFAASINGAAVSTDVSGSIPTVTTFKLGSVSGSGQYANSYLRRITYYPRRLSNAELVSLTS